MEQVDRYAGLAVGFPHGVTPAVTSRFIILTLSYRGVQLWAIQLFPEVPSEPRACRCVINEDGSALILVQGCSSDAQRSGQQQIAWGLYLIFCNTFLLIIALVRCCLFWIGKCFFFNFTMKKTTWQHRMTFITQAAVTESVNRLKGSVFRPKLILLCDYEKRKCCTSVHSLAFRFRFWNNLANLQPHAFFKAKKKKQRKETPSPKKTSKKIDIDMCVKALHFFIFIIC